MHSEAQTKSQMDAMYRWTRHVYDISRKYYLLGRDRLIENLNAQADEQIIEVGCGTARNLIKMAQTYPQSRFYGFDASDEMLKTAQASVQKTRTNITLRQAYAQSFDPKTLFGMSKKPRKLVFSYALSIIPPWKESIEHALAVLPKGGEMHIVDFGSMDGQPPWFRSFIFWWLKQFHVYHKPEILNYLQRLQEEKKGTLEITHLYKGYAYLAIFKKT